MSCNVRFLILYREKTVYTVDIQSIEESERFSRGSLISVIQCSEFRNEHISISSFLLFLVQVFYHEVFSSFLY